MANIEPMAPSETIRLSDGNVYECYQLACASAHIDELQDWSRANGYHVAAGSTCLVVDTCEVYAYNQTTDAWAVL